MFRMSRHVVLGFAAHLVAAAVAASLEGQVQRMRAGPATTVGIEVTRSVGGRVDLAWYTSVLRGRVIAPFAERTALVADWAVSVAGEDGRAGATLASPEVGVVILDEEGVSTGFISFVLPLATGVGESEAVSASTGARTDVTWYNRFDATTWSLNLGYTPSIVSRDGATRAVLEGIVSVIVPRSDASPSLLARYVFGFVHDTGAMRFRGNLVALGSPVLGSLAPILYHAEAGLARSQDGPGFFVRLPLEDSLADMGLVVGATYTF